MKLTKEFGKGYDVSNLKRMRQFYLMIQKGATVCHQLSWSHYRCLLSIKQQKELNYYIYITKNHSLSVRELQARIKSKEYERIGYKEELSESRVNTLIKEPIIINTRAVSNKINELFVHNSIMEDMDNFLKELGIGFTYVGHEVKIKIGENKHSIDFLFFNYKFNCFVVVEIKIDKFRAEYISQVKKYINYVDENIKENVNDKTIGIVICKEVNGYVLKYCTDSRIFTTTYKLKTGGLYENIGS